jgi:hypothetical protein
LLRETYSSNYQTVNVVLALILGVFSIIGILGIRDIGQIRKAGIARRNETCSSQDDQIQELNL